MRDISKMIKKGNRNKKRSRRHEKVQNMLEEFNRIQSIAYIKPRKRKFSSHI